MAIRKASAGVEDLNLGMSTRTQLRKGQEVIITDINGNHIPYSDTQSLNQKMESVESVAGSFQGQLDAHKGDVSNPHQVTYDQTGAAPVVHEHNVDYFTKTQFIQTSAGAIDQGKPIELNSVGLVDDTMLPTVPPLHNHDDRYFTETEHITIAAGSVDAGKPIKLNALGIVDSTMLPAEVTGEYYALNGSKPLTANFAGGGFKLTSIANGTGGGDAATYNQIVACYALDGSRGLVANFDGGGYRLTNIAAGTNNGDAVILQQLLECVNKGGDGMTGPLYIVAGATGTQAMQAQEIVALANSTPFYYNHIINGNFDIWQRGTSQTAHGYGSDDRWGNEHSGSTKTHSKQTYPAGAVYADGTIAPPYYSRTVVSSVAGAGSYVVKPQRVEDVTKLAGKTVTCSFYASSDAARPIAVEGAQVFGTGGSPSTAITAIGVTKINLTTTETRYDVTITFPSISGKTFGTDGLHTSYTGVYFWFDAGSNFNDRTDSLGQQSGTFNISKVQLIEKNSYGKTIPRSVAEEFELCRRYYRYLTNIVRLTPIIDNKYIYGHFALGTPMRVSPAILSSTLSTFNTTWDNESITTGRDALFFHRRCVTGATASTGYTQITSIELSAEL